MTGRSLASAIVLAVVTSATVSAHSGAAMGAQVIATITGTVGSGSVFPSSKGNVFGFPPGTDLTGKGFTLVFQVDDKKGRKFSAPNGGYYRIESTPPSQPGGTDASNPITAVFTISGGASVTFGDSPSPAISVAARGAQTDLTTNQVSFTTGDIRNSSKTSGSSGIIIQAYLDQAVANDVESSLNYSWPLSCITITCKITRGSFSWDVFNFGGNVPAYTDHAQGTLLLSTMIVSGKISPPKTPHIFFLDVATGRYVDTTNKTQTVVAGQPIYVFAVPPDKTKTKPWSVGGGPIGSYSATPCVGISCPPGKVIPVDLSVPTSASFYWTAPRVGAGVTYHYGTTEKVTAKFNVVGPKPPAATFYSSIGQPDIRPGTNLLSLWGLVLKASVFEAIPVNPPIETGVYYDALVMAPSGVLGYLEWVQLLRKDTVATRDAATQKVTGCASVGDPDSPGLDNSYPYAGTVYPGKGESISFDAPAVNLQQQVDLAVHSIYGEMYLMWHSLIPSSIPVPLGFITWEYFNRAQLINGTWVVDHATSFARKGPFVRKTVFPEWSFTIPNGPPLHCTK